MRIISGKYKGKQIEGFNIDGTRPTMDRVKESLFGSIQNYIKESICLDLFAGSGSLGFEALSNGASKCFFVDNNNIVIKQLNKTINSLNTPNSIVLNKDYKDALNKFKNDNIKFDLIFLDPPYKFNLIDNCLELIDKYNLLNDNGLIICEYETEEFDIKSFKLLKEKKYGLKKIKIITR